MTVATKKYEAKQAEIAMTAFRLFREKGFEKTSIKEIAEASGNKKALVQYYFPKKTDFEDYFLSLSLDTALPLLKELGIKDSSPFLQIGCLGYFELYYVTQHESMQKLAVDIMNSREITSSIIQTIFQWCLENINIPSIFIKTAQFALTYTIGGAFETIYASMRDEKPVDIDHVFDSAIKVLNKLLGVPIGKFKIPSLLTDDWLEDKCNYMDKVIFGEYPEETGTESAE